MYTLTKVEETRMIRARRLTQVALVGVALVAMLTIASIASAAELQVTATGDTGPGTLRQAIADAAPGDTITFAAGGQGVIYLGSPLTVDKTLTIAGASSDNVVISGNFATDLIHVTDDASLTLSGVTLTEGFATTAEWAAVLTNPGAGTVTLNHVVVENNIAAVNLLPYILPPAASSRLDAFRRAAASLSTSPQRTADVRSLHSNASTLTQRGRAGFDLPNPSDYACLVSTTCVVPGISVIWSGNPYWGDNPSDGGTSHLIIRDSTVTNNDATGGIVDSVSGPGGSVDVNGTTFSSNNAKPFPGLFETPKSVTFFVLPALVVAGSSPVTITGSTFTRNTGLLGSAVAIFSSGETEQPVTIRDSSFAANSGVIFGPLIVSGVAGTVTLSGSDFSANSAGSNVISQLIGSYGGGAIIQAAHTAIDTTSFTDNAATFGGALIANGGEVSITSSTVAGNHALYVGGVVMGFSVPLVGSSGGLVAGSITNSTIVGNTQVGFTDSGGAGGLALAGESNTLANDTITGNSGGLGTGGVWLGYAEGTSNALAVRNSIISGNRAGDGANLGCDPRSTSLMLQGANLITPDAITSFPCAYDTTEHLLTTDPKLGTLGTYNWGTTSTMPTVPLLAGSPAIDAALGATPTTDERGVARPQGAAGDLGAYEARPPHLSLSVTAPDTVGFGSPIDYTLVVANAGDLGAMGATLTSPLPGFVKYVSTTGTACTWATKVLTCPIGNLDGNAIVTNVVTTKAVAPGTAVAAWTLAAPSVSSATVTATTEITTSEAPMVLYKATQSATGLTFRVHSSTGGTIQISMGSDPSGRARRPAMCTAAKKVKHAATTTVTCRYTRAARKSLHSHTARALATISFTPVVGAKTTMHQRLYLRRLGPSQTKQANSQSAEQPAG